VSSALVGLGKAAREAKGEKNGVVRIVYIAAFLVPEGVSLLERVGEEPLGRWGVQVS
jgi:hypothetical protein